MPETRLANLLQAADAGDAMARDRLFTLLYGDLRRMARRHLRANGTTTLSPTTLLHETFLNMAQRKTLVFANYGQFMSYAGRAMRGLIIDYLRSSRSSKRGGDVHLESLAIELPYATHDPWTVEFENLNEALAALAHLDPKLAECVDLKFFCGFSFDEIAKLRNVSERTARRDWDLARLLLNELLIKQET